MAAINKYEWRCAGSPWKSMSDFPMVLDDITDFMNRAYISFLTFDSPEGKVDIRLRDQEGEKK